MVNKLGKFQKFIIFHTILLETRMTLRFYFAPVKHCKACIFRVHVFFANFAFFSSNAKYSYREMFRATHWKQTMKYRMSFPVSLTHVPHISATYFLEFSVMSRAGLEKHLDFKIIYVKKCSIFSNTENTENTVIFHWTLLQISFLMELKLKWK